MGFPAFLLFGLLVVAVTGEPSSAGTAGLATGSPLILFTSEDIAPLRSKVQDGGEDGRAYASILSRWESYASAPPESLLAGPLIGSNVVSELGLLAHVENPGTAPRQKLREMVLHLAWTTDVDLDDFASSMRLRTLALGFDMGFRNAPFGDRVEVLSEIESYLVFMQSETAYTAFALNPYVSNRGMTVGSSMGLAVIAIWDEVSESEHPWLLETLEFADSLVEKCLDDLLAFDGAYREGVLYGAWTMRMALPYIEARRRFDGIDLAAGRPFMAMVEWLAYEVLPEGGGRTNNLNDSPLFSSPLAAHSTILSWAEMRARSPIARWVYRHVAGDYGAPERDVTDRTATVLWSRTIPDLDPTTMPLPASRFFPYRGLYIHRSGWKSAATGTETHFAFYAGRFLGGHAQEDQGQFTLYAHGDRYALDNGSAYPTSLPKETEAHNLVLVDGRGQHNAGQSIGTDGTITSMQLSPFCDYLRADLRSAYSTHSPYNDPNVPLPGTDWSWGYDGGNPVLRAERLVAVVHGPEAPTWFWIADDIRKDTVPHVYDWALHTDPINVVDLTSDPVTIQGTASRLALWFAHPRPAELALSCAPFDNGGEDPSTRRLVARSSSVEPRFVTALVPLPATLATPAAGVVQIGRGTALHLDWGEVQDIAVANPTDSLFPGPLRTDGRMAVARVAGGDVRHWMLAEGRSLAFQSLDLIVLDRVGTAALSGSTLQLGWREAQFVAYGPQVTAVLDPAGLPVPFVRDGPWVRSSTLPGPSKRPPHQRASGLEPVFEITVDCAAPPTEIVRVVLHDVRGRVIRSLGYPRAGASPALLTWDGTDDRGKRVAAGIYFARVAGCRDGTVRRLVVVR